MMMVSLPQTQTQLFQFLFMLTDFFEEEEEGGSKKRVMSVELALQREYAYVGKVAKLQFELHQNVKHQNTPVPVQVPPSTSQHGVDEKLASENLSRLAPLELQKAYAKQTQPSENLSCSPAYLKYHKKPLQTRPSDNFSSQPGQRLHQSFTKQASQIQPSEDVLSLLSPKPPSFPTQTLQIQPSDTLSSLPPPQLRDSCHKQTVQIQNSDNILCLPPLQRQQFVSERTLQIQRSQNLTCLPPEQKQQSYAKRSPRIQTARNPIHIPPPQLLRHFSRRIPLVQKAGLFCKECQIPCTGVLDYKQHCRGRKHRARVQELKMVKKQRKNNEGSTAVKPLWCDICQVASTDEHGFLLHLNGKKHAACVQAINSARAAQVVMGEASTGGGLGRYAVETAF